MDIHALPPEIVGPSAWLGPQASASTDWVHHLTDLELSELELAARRALETHSDIASIRREAFVLPTLGPRLAHLHDVLIHGCGFALVRALPVKDWPRAVTAAAFYGLGCHLGYPVPQNAKGHVLGHVTDMGLNADDPKVRIYQTHERQTFHTDSSDIVGLVCLQQAKSGGDSALVSSNTIYNVMRRDYPELAAALFDPIATDRRGDEGPGQKPYFEIPVFTWYAQMMSTIYQRQYIDSAQRFAQAMRLTPLHVEALDCFDALANDRRLNFLMRLEAGDMQFVHNHTLLHDRTAFEDWNEPGRKRHLLRLWLSSPRARPLPAVWAERYGTVEPGVRGGVSVPAAQWIAPLNPE
ncbi:TauD/TfdA family dioxygenase [Zwartia vadi]|uniref:TauD/TfdA family dioxygenase n=1 Tax=Zwartia vadi TaxID=3058168 RepID=UPI0025B2880B|nr:TauD/TfdA family dioxygenase [Zwartia vadi]MDN3988308.1 TauD/TfdA family dioxygenase [Zwartia vadi]